MKVNTYSSLFHHKITFAGIESNISFRGKPKSVVPQTAIMKCSRNQERHNFGGHVYGS